MGRRERLNITFGIKKWKLPNVKSLYNNTRKNFISIEGKRMVVFLNAFNCYCDYQFLIEPCWIYVITLVFEMVQNTQMKSSRNYLCVFIIMPHLWALCFLVCASVCLFVFSFWSRQFLMKLKSNQLEKLSTHVRYDMIFLILMPNQRFYPINIENHSANGASVHWGHILVMTCGNCIHLFNHHLPTFNMLFVLKLRKRLGEELPYFRYTQTCDSYDFNGIY